MFELRLLSYIRWQVYSIFQVKGTVHGQLLSWIFISIFVVIATITCCLCCCCCGLILNDRETEKELTKDDTEEKKSAFHEKIKDHIEKLKVIKLIY